MSDLMPLVSVIVPSYNHEKFVEHTIESIVNQTYKNIELIVIDDGSKDNSPNILANLSNKYKFYFEKQNNIGLSATLNKMIKMAKGEYISLIASDDIKTLDKVEILVNEFEKLDDKFAVVSGNALMIDEEGKATYMEKDNNKFFDFVSPRTIDRKEFNLDAEFGSFETLIGGNYIPAMSTLIRKTALLEVGLYDEDVAMEDWSMWLKLSEKYKMQFIDKVVAYYRWHSTNSIKTMSNRLSMDMIKILENEKSHCIQNKLYTLWKKKYYDAIIYLYKNNKKGQFLSKVVMNNLIFYNLKHVIQKFQKYRFKITKNH